MRWRKRAIGVAAIATVTGLVLAGCSTNSQSPAESSPDRPVTVMSSVVASNLDPAAMSDSPSLSYVRNVYDPLLEYDLSTKKYTPYLATKWAASDDAKTYTFQLRSGVIFHDGSGLSAEGVKTALDRMMKIGKGYAYLLSNVAGISATSKLELAVTLKSPDVAFLNKLGGIYIPSAKAIADHLGSDDAQAWLASHDAGSGPYRLSSYTPGNEFVVKKYSKYWGGWSGSHVSAYDVKVGDPTTAALGIRQGTVDLADYISNQDISTLEKSGKYKIYKGAGSPWYLALNTADGHLTDKSVRKAISIAIPYKEIIRDIMLGIPSRLAGPVPSWTIGANPDVSPTPTDLAKAKQLMEAAGYSSDHPLKLSLIYYNGLDFEKTISTVVQSSLAKIGVSLSVEGATWPTLTSKAANASTRPDMGLITVSSPSPDAGPLLSAVFDPDNAGNWQYWGYTGAAVDQIKAAAAATTVDSQVSLYQQAEATLTDDYASIWLMNSPFVWVAQKAMKNVSVGYGASSFDFYQASRG